MVQEESSEKFLETINRINFQKWHSKVRIVISKDIEFEVIALIDSGADLNCIQKGIIPSKYFKKTRERLTSASGGKMQIQFKVPKAHVCQDNTCFRTTFVIVKNMTDRVILGNLFMCRYILSPEIVRESLPIILASQSDSSFLGALNLEKSIISRMFLSPRPLILWLPKSTKDANKPRTLTLLHLLPLVQLLKFLAPISPKFHHIIKTLTLYHLMFLIAFLKRKFIIPI